VQNNNEKHHRNDVTIVPVRRGRFPVEWLTIALVVLVAAAAWGLVWHLTPAGDTSAREPLYQPQELLKELEVIFLDVRQGDATLVITPNGHVALIDAGQGKTQFTHYDAGIQTIMPYLARRGIDRIDTMVMTHPHADHYGGMISIASAMKVGEYLDPGMDHTAPTYLALLETIEQQQITYREIAAPMILDWDPDILVQVIWPEEGFATTNPNDVSIVLRIVYGDVVYLLPGDVETEVESVLSLYGSDLRTTVLKVPHHGSNTSSSRRFLETIVPRLAVISVGYQNRFDHPKDDIVNRYERMEIPIVRTDRHGTIRTVTDGKTVNIHPELGSAFTIYPFPGIPPEETL
jgi:competence protein ComEC